MCWARGGSALCLLLLLRLLQEYEARKAEDPEFYRAVDSLQYGGSGKVPEENIEKMVAELNDRWVQPLGLRGAGRIRNAALTLLST